MLFLFEGTILDVFFAASMINKILLSLSYRLLHTVLYNIKNLFFMEGAILDVFFAASMVNKVSWSYSEQSSTSRCLNSDATIEVIEIPEKKKL